jgi:chromosome segregation ATPase
LDRAEQALAELEETHAALQERSANALQAVAQFEAQIIEQTQRLETEHAEMLSARRQLEVKAAAVDDLETALRARDTLLETLRIDLQTSLDERVIISGQLEKLRARSKHLTREIFMRDNRIATLKADLAVHVETLATIRQDVNRVGGDASSAQAEDQEKFLEPVDHAGEPIPLNRKVMTIGRTEENDVCIPSKLISRHHARLLIGPNAVIVEDTDSTNGCYVNDRQVKQQLMREGDVLSIGDLRFRLATRGGAVPRPPREGSNVIPFADSMQHKSE